MTVLIDVAGVASVWFVGILAGDVNDGLGIEAGETVDGARAGSSDELSLLLQKEKSTAVASKITRIKDKSKNDSLEHIV
ncbi:hypothetical protein PF005_g8880 [Phytophthora fragariae]|uniref:Uncharacterized protein n=1 Tax=Phytophthora fragariae TaxID=53985 RepID=A0A6A3FCI3_9STRA|nr:hypothetical protein PF003_g15033 [Phytophthora fragariae]KAE8943012.1 hypothetical protein PF009_g7239 [Phytophthora fragariae]KAE9014198.1 hypothetical protein PF011_g8168 [Phytophthora fragariae]KAE9122169.1 hypothetical protein PF010_g6839 [Phytophthora fragariae]KAE9146821.1 hypothetical protein PF006_g8441 [Phytophthora fragariae]